MRRLTKRAFAALATSAALAAGLSPASASADPTLVFPGMEIHQDNRVCTLGYVDPAARIAYTAGHCRGGGPVVTDRDHNVIGRLAAFRDNTPSGTTVATDQVIADYEVIVLDASVAVSNILPGGRRLESTPGVGGSAGPSDLPLRRHQPVKPAEPWKASTTGGSPCPTASRAKKAIRADLCTWRPMAAPGSWWGFSTASGANFRRRCRGRPPPSRSARISAGRREPC